jgi:hypothetical protein
LLGGDYPPLKKRLDPRIFTTGNENLGNIRQLLNKKLASAPQPLYKASISPAHVLVFSSVYFLRIKRVKQKAIERKPVAESV